ncbi:MAG: FAD/NAD(P)-binding protein [Thermoplasmatales archaeon]
MNEYLPKAMNVKKMTEETPDVYTLELDAKNDGKSGQFFMVSMLGTGEAPISVASGFGRRIVFTIRSIGSVTSRVKNSKTIGVRGPYGSSWPWNEYEEIVAVAGGIGIPPIRSLIEEMIDARRSEDIELLYGARTPSDIVYKNKLKEWGNTLDIHITVDRGDEGWNGKVGFVPSLLKDSHLSRKAAVFIIGPPLMMKNTVREALNLGYQEENIFLSLERRMECGIGVCGHCNVGHLYVCESGPIFKYASVKEEKELFL